MVEWEYEIKLVKRFQVQYTQEFNYIKLQTPALQKQIFQINCVLTLYLRHPFISIQFNIYILCLHMQNHDTATLHPIALWLHHVAKGTNKTFCTFMLFGPCNAKKLRIASTAHNCLARRRRRSGRNKNWFIACSFHGCNLF